MIFHDESPMRMRNWWPSSYWEPISVDLETDLFSFCQLGTLQFVPSLVYRGRQLLQTPCDVMMDKRNTKTHNPKKNECVQTSEETKSSRACGQMHGHHVNKYHPAAYI